MDGLETMTNDKNITNRELYSQCINAIKICLDSLEYIKDNSPTNGTIRGRAKKTIAEVNRVLQLNK